MLNFTLLGDLSCNFKLSSLFKKLPKNSLYIAVCLLIFNSQVTAQFCSTSSLVNQGVLVPTTTNQTTSSVASGSRYYWTFNATAGCTYTFSTCGNSVMDTYLRIYSGTNPSTAIELTFSDDDCGGDLQSNIVWTCVTSGSYSLLLTRYIIFPPNDCAKLNDFASISYQVACASPPTNDLCANAETITIPCSGASSSIPGTTLDATEEAIAKPSCDDIGTINDVWYTFNTGGSSSVDFTVTLGSASWIGGEVFSSCGVLASGLSIGGGPGNCDFNFSLPSPTTISGLSTNTTYFIRLFTNTDYDIPGSFSFTVGNTVPLSAPATPGSITGSTSLCENATNNTYSIAAVSGATSYTWSVPSGATIVSGQGTISVVVDFGVTSGDVSVTATNSCGTSVARTQAINIIVAPNAGGDGSLTICAGTTVAAGDLYSSMTGSPDAGGAWSPTLAGAGTYIYTVAATSPCSTDATASVTVTEQAQPNAGTNGTLTICAGTTVTAADLFGALTGTPQSGGTWSPTLAGAGTYTYTVAATSPCATDATSTVTVTEQTAPDAGTNGALTICQGTTVSAAELFGALTGTPQSGGTWLPALAGAGTYTYTITAAGCADATASVTVTEQAQPNAGSNGTLTICAGTTVTAADLFGALTGTPQSGGTWLPTLAGAGTYTYTVAATAPCATDANSTVTVTEQAQPNAGSNGTLTICAGTTVTVADLFGALTGTPQSGGTWSPALAGAGTYTYTVTAAGCTDATASVTVTEQAQPNAGTNGTLTICAGTTVSAAELFGALTGTPQSGGTWSPTLAGAGTYTYTVAATSPCATDATSTVTVTEQTAPDAGTNGTLTICAGTTVSAAELFGALTGTPQAGGTWLPALAGAGTYTYSVTAAGCTDATATVTVNDQAQPNAGTSGTLTRGLGWNT
jgi:hypothetical protein